MTIQYIRQRARLFTQGIMLDIYLQDIAIVTPIGGLSSRNIQASHSHQSPGPKNYTHTWPMYRPARPIWG